MHAPAEFPPRTETTDANGVTTIVEYRLNDEGKRVKVTRRIKRTLVKKHVNHVVAERMHWKKWARGLFFTGTVFEGGNVDATSAACRFGLEKNSPAGPTSTTTVGETVRLKIQAGGIKARRLSLLGKTFTPKTDPLFAPARRRRTKRTRWRRCGSS